MTISSRGGISHEDFSPISNGSGMSTYTQTGTITWSGTGAPSGTLTAEYAWQQVGKDVTLMIVLNYAVAGNAVNGVTLELPSDAPPPATIAGVGLSASEYAWIGTGGLTTAKTTIFTTNGRAAIQRNAGNNGWNIHIVSSSVNALQASGWFQYKTA